MNLKKELEKFDLAEKALHKQIDDEVALENEIQEVAKYTARQLSSKPMAFMSIQKRDFVVLAVNQFDAQGRRCIQVVAREKTLIDTINATIIKADLVVDTNYTMEENLLACIKALLGHITGHIKPEALE